MKVDKYRYSAVVPTTVLSFIRVIVTNKMASNGTSACFSPLLFSFLLFSSGLISSVCNLLLIFVFCFVLYY